MLEKENGTTENAKKEKNGSAESISKAFWVDSPAVIQTQFRPPFNDTSSRELMVSNLSYPPCERL